MVLRLHIQGMTESTTMREYEIPIRYRSATAKTPIMEVLHTLRSINMLGVDRSDAEHRAKALVEALVDEIEWL